MSTAADSITVSRLDGAPREGAPRQGSTRLAWARRAPHRGDDPGRRRHAAHRFRPLHHRMEAGDRGDPAAHRERLAGGFRRLSEDPRISRAEAGHEPRSVQDHLLVGVEPPLPRPADRHRLPPALPRLLDRRLHPESSVAAARRPVRARRPARRRRLVHGEERPRLPRRREPVPARSPSRHRRRHPRLHALAYFRSWAGARRASPSRAHALRHGSPAPCSP